MGTKTILMPGRGRDEDTGRYTEEYPAETFIDAIGDLGGAAGTQELADHVGCKYRTAYGKLRALEDEGDVSSRKVGNARLWRAADE
jgi:hypothetical protein